jgi:tRNA modification GTPase
MHYNSHDTIAAIATPIGVGGIAVIRISGSSAFICADAVFRGSISAANAPSHTIHFGTIADPVSRETIDTVLLSVFRTPHSFTGEDVVEISSHGGYFVSQKILSLLYRNGSRPAEPGEFTLRAFMNGKLDLAQAEAVADIIHSKTEKSHRASIEQLSGKLSDSVRHLREEILNICSLLELELDFSQEGIELAEKSIVTERLSSIENNIRTLSSSYQEGKLIKEGIKVALVGKPNAGKSSLLNVLLREERAIVSDIPGTTRDTIEESVLLDGIEFIFNDTAGLRESSDAIEIEGIKRTGATISSSDIVLIVIDSSLPMMGSDIQTYSSISMECQKRGGHVAWVFNKKDLSGTSGIPSEVYPNVRISCKSHDGVAELKTMLREIALPHHDPSSSSVTITNIRHKDALERALTSIGSAKKTIEDGLGGDFASVDLRGALNYLGEIIGLTTPDDILNNIFSNFCIGK